MSPHTKIPSWALLLFLSLSFSACKGQGEKLTSDDLPDLNKQTRPYVTVETAVVRAGPGGQFRSVGKIPPKAKIHVIGRDGDWLLIVSKKGNAPGFIEMASAQPGKGEEPEADTAPPAEGRYETLMDTQLRSGPGLHYPVVAEIPKGIKLNVVDKEKGWFKVESKQGKKPGYVEAGLTRPASDR